MAKAKNYIIGLLTLIVLATSLIISFPSQDISATITKTSTSFYLNQSGNMTLIGVETGKLYNGTKLISILASECRIVRPPA